MSANIYNAAELPRWLIANTDAADLNYADNDFIIHCHAPRFIMRMAGDGSKSEDVQFIDPIEDPMKIAGLMREAGDFYAAEIQSLEEGDK